MAHPKKIGLLIWLVSNYWQAKLRKILIEFNISLNEYLILESLYELQYKYDYARNVEILASFYSTKGYNFFKLTRLNLQYKANDLGISSSDTDKDF